MSIKKICLNCQHGIAIIINNDIFCKRKGIVSKNYSCSKFQEKAYSNSITKSCYNCIDCENFIIKEDEGLDNTKGYCHLFTVRLFDGKKKNICSKFVKKVRANIS